MQTIKAMVLTAADAPITESLFAQARSAMERRPEVRSKLLEVRNIRFVEMRKDGYVTADEVSVDLSSIGMSAFIFSADLEG